MMRRFAGGALAAALAVLVYVNALDNPFVYDDRDTVVANPSLVDLSNIRFILTHSPFRPVVNVSYALDRAIWGTNPLGFHLSNLILHVLVVLLLHALLRRAFADSRARQGLGSDELHSSEAWAAFAGAALFAVHPLMSEAVGYVSGRSELLCGVFFLCALSWARRGMLGHRMAWLIAAIFAVFALLSKEVALVFPIVAVAYDWLLLRDTTRNRRRRMMAVFVPAIVLLVIAAAYRVSSMAGTIPGEAPLLNLWTQAIVIWRYMGLLLLPIGQSIMHGVHRVTSIGDLRALVAILGLITLAVVAFVCRGGFPVVSFGVLWFLVTITPSSSVVALREGMAEHRAYLASAGLFVAIAGGAVAMTPANVRGRSRVAYAAILVALFGVLGTLTVMRNEVWATPVTLWQEATVHATGMWEPHYALGDALRESGDCARAVDEYEIVVEMRPQHRDAYTNLGICLAQTQRLAEAQAAFERVIQIDPAFARGYTNLGALALLVGRPDAARDAYRKAIEVEPGNVLARMQLARLYETVFGDFHRAARMCGEARALAPFTPGVTECVERNQRLAAAKDSGR